MGEELLQEAFVQRHPEWVKELQIMLKSGEKAEIQVMTVWVVMSLFHHPDS
jgi:DNA topoisomerase VI subunit A